jgi:hypothetical protein
MHDPRTTLEIPIPLPPLRPRKRLKRRPTLDRGREYLDELVAVGADPPSVADEPDDAEQVALNHERMKPHGPWSGSTRRSTRAC